MLFVMTYSICSLMQFVCLCAYLMKVQFIWRMWCLLNYVVRQSVKHINWMFPVQACDLNFWWVCIYNKIKNKLFRIGLCCLCGYSRRSCIYLFPGTSSNWSFVIRSFVLSYEQLMSLCFIVVICQSCCSFRCQWQHTFNCHCWRNFFLCLFEQLNYIWNILISCWCCVTNLLHVCLLAAVVMYGRLQLMQSTTGGDTMSPLLWWAVYVTTLMT